MKNTKKEDIYTLTSSFLCISWSFCDDIGTRNRANKGREKDTTISLFTHKKKKSEVKYWQISMEGEFSPTANFSHCELESCVRRRCITHKIHQTRFADFRASLWCAWDDRMSLSPIPAWLLVQGEEWWWGYFWGSVWLLYTGYKLPNVPGWCISSAVIATQHF